MYTHQSLHSAGEESELFPEMFPDSAIANDFSMSAAMLSDVINHGLAPYFKTQIMKELALKGHGLPPRFISCFDESFIKVQFSKQMDIHVIHAEKTIS